jgi:predicted RecA/RadA family phage recombinase
MAQTEFFQFLSDDTVFDHTPSSRMEAGDIAVISTHLFGIAAKVIPANTLGALKASGIGRAKKHTGNTFSQGDLVYYNSVNGDVQSSPTLVCLGVAVKAAVSADEFVETMLRNTNNNPTST